MLAKVQVLARQVFVWLETLFLMGSWVVPLLLFLWSRKHEEGFRAMVLKQGSK